MIKIEINESALKVTKKEAIVSGSIGIYKALFEFDSTWDGLSRKAVFEAGVIRKEVLLSNTGICDVPWEVLGHENVGKALKVGVYGTDATGALVRPTVYGKASDSILQGVGGATSGNEPSPDVYNQILTIMSDTEKLVQDIREDIDAGILKGDKGDQGEQGDRGETGLQGPRGESFDSKDVGRIDENEASITVLQNTIGTLNETLSARLAGEI